MDAAAVLRASSHKVALTVRTKGHYPTGNNGEALPSYRLATGCDIFGTTEDRLSALADLEKFLSPPECRQVEEWLAELDAISARRADDEIGDALRLAAYASRLCEYPADVVRYALLKKTWKWFPTWDELRVVCEAKASPRRCMVAALKNPAPEPKQERRAATDEERQRIQALVNETFPEISEEWREEAVKSALAGDCMMGGA